jgi:hypothetical protein
MQRRDVLRLLTSSAVLSVMPLQATLALREARAQVGLFSGVRTMNPHQNATVTTICELIIPATDTPGATGAKVNEFIDLLLTEWFDAAETQRFLAGLAEVDTISHKRFGADFLSCSPAQQTELMKQFDEEAMRFASSQRLAARQPAPQKLVAQNHAQNPKLPPHNFFYELKRLTLVGYYTSEIGFTQDLGLSIIPPGHDGCAPLREPAR